MTPDAERLQKLREFGLSEYASRAYLALLELGTTEARDVSRLARVPIAKIYSTLDQLQQRGLALVEPGPPKKYSPVLFREFLARQRMAHEEEIRQLELEEAALSEMFPIRADREADDRGVVLTLRGRSNVMAKLDDLVLSARRDVLLVVPDGASTRLDARRHVFEAAAARGVRLRFLAPDTPPSCASCGKLADLADARARPPMPGAGASTMVVAVDENVVLLAHAVPDDGSFTRGNDLAIVTTETGIVRAVAAMMDALWHEAAPLGREGQAPVQAPVGAAGAQGARSEPMLSGAATR